MKTQHSIARKQQHKQQQRRLRQQRERGVALACREEGLLWRTCRLRFVRGEFILRMVLTTASTKVSPMYASGTARTQGRLEDPTRGPGTSSTAADATALASSTPSVSHDSSSSSSSTTATDSASSVSTTSAASASCGSVFLGRVLFPLRLFFASATTLDLDAHLVSSAFFGILISVKLVLCDTLGIAKREQTCALHRLSGCSCCCRLMLES